VPNQAETQKRKRHYGANVAQAIAEYNPLRAPIKTCTPSEWETIKPLVLSAVSALTDTTPKRAKFHMTAMTKLATWALREEYDLDLTNLLDPDVIETFVSSIPNNQASWRSSLRLLARAQGVEVLATQVRYPRPTSSSPYTASEVASLLAFARSLTNTYRGHSIEAAVLLGAGAGIARGDLRAITAQSVHEHDGSLHVATSTRCVPVLSEFTDDLIALCLLRPKGQLIGNTKSDEFTTMIRQWVGDRPGTPVFSSDRLRAFFICEHLRRGTGTLELLALTGLQTIEGLDVFQQFLPARVATCDLVSGDLVNGDLVSGDMANGDL
jgi:hypothetical protein